MSTVQVNDCRLQDEEGGRGLQTGENGRWLGDYRGLRWWKSSVLGH